MAKINCVFAFLLFISGAFAASLGNATQEKISVTVYYEALCPDSIKFFVNQLYPGVVNMTDYVDLTLVPFGRATYNITEGNQYKFMCHHGELECEGNKVQACALKILPSAVNTYKYISCMMEMMAGSNKSGAYPGNQCASANGIDYKPIETCAQTRQGDEYLAALGDMTVALEPMLKSVPTIVFNDKFSKEDNEFAQVNFKMALCNHISGTKPDQCSENNDSVGKNSAPSALIGSCGLLPITTLTSVILAVSTRM
ncbi:GILT-like protein 1 [Lycorma delicatula]|uniref:GILT-like protein 1 n=1 Tax=Lycorma delicatula TaxID=130591 RepID=UPI003F516DCC